MTDLSTLTAEQEKLVQFEPEGNLLIRGEAGSGKTTVLAHRGAWIRGQRKGSILFLAYNAAVEAYTQRLLQAEASDPDIEVRTFHSWVGTFVSRLGGTLSDIADKNTREQLLQQALSEHRSRWGHHRLFNSSTNFWFEEFGWLFGRHVTRGRDYEAMPRTGRGSQVRVGRGEDRSCVWDVFSSYKKLLKARNLKDQDDVVGAVLEAVEAQNGRFPEQLRYDHVFVDEVQDFDASWLMAVAPIPRISLTLAGDLAQRIYRRTFTWKEVGIELPAHRSRKLMGSHRTTKEIMQVAQYLAENQDLKSDPDYVPPSIPNRSGPKVCRIVRSKWWEADKEAVLQAGRLLRKDPGKTVVLGCQFNKNMSKLSETAAAQGIPTVQAKGRDLDFGSTRVLITTLFQLKGLEFDHVVLSGLGDTTIPGFYLKQAGSETDEEKQNFLKRLLYVAMTRARNSLTLVGDIPFCRFFDAVPDSYFEDR